MQTKTREVKKGDMVRFNDHTFEVVAVFPEYGTCNLSNYKECVSARDVPLRLVTPLAPQGEG